MICRNCGFQNAPGDTFCGSCGKFLEWTGEEAGPANGAGGGGGGVGDETTVTPIYSEAGTQPPVQEPAGPPQMAHPVAQQQTYGAIECWNCGRRNPSGRSFCMQCGERLSTSSLAGSAIGGRPGMARRDSGTRTKMLGAAIGLLAVLLLAGGAAAFLFGGQGPGPSPTTGAVTSPSPEPTSEPTVEPTLAPTGEPTVAPTEQPPTEPPATPAPLVPDCSQSTVPTNWVNLSGGDTHARVRRGEYWCIHQVIVVPDPNFGEGRIRLRVGDNVLVEVNHAAGGATEYPFPFVPAHLVPPRTDVDYRMRCATDFCNAIIQVGYELRAVP